MSRTDNEDVPVFLKYAVSGEEHVFVRSDWIMEFLYRHLSDEDGHRVSTKLHAERLLAEQGHEAAKNFLAMFGVAEH